MIRRAFGPQEEALLVPQLSGGQGWNRITDTRIFRWRSSVGRLGSFLNDAGFAILQRDGECDHTAPHCHGH